MTDPALTQKMDALLQETYAPDKPGAAVIVMKAGQVLLREGYGMANLELNVPVEPHMVFRIGSVTKQFTAVCILMLLEEGKLSLQDEITRFLPDYPTQGRKITIEHLLTHTSGIQSYTDMTEWLPLWRKDLSLDELIDLFKGQPMQFEPGERFAYNNSGYILLGAIIEKISGMPYAQYVQERIFDRLGMAHSLYDDPARIVPGRAAGYSLGTDGYINTPYLSMTQPYAAGSLASSVDDLARWDAALSAGELLKPETLALAHQPYHLLDGTSACYGYGWGVAVYEGFLFQEHGGGINGFLCGTARVPQAQVYVAVLTNLEAPQPDPSMLAFQLAAMSIGKPYAAPIPIDVPADVLQDYVGVYTINEKEDRVVTCVEGQLYSQRSGSMRLKLYPFAPDKFFIGENPDQFIFLRGEEGQVNAMQIERRFGPPERTLKSDKPLPQERASMALEPASLVRYVGVYELAPGYAITISEENGSLHIQPPGQPKLALLAETPERLFPREVELTVVFAFDAQGQAVSFTLYQGTEEYICKKVG